MAEQLRVLIQRWFTGPPPATGVCPAGGTGNLPEVKFCTGCGGALA